MIPEMTRMMWCDYCKQEERHKILTKHQYTSNEGQKMMCLKYCIPCAKRKGKIEWEFETIFVKDYYALVNSPCV